MSNKALNRCRTATDNDEFYTLYEDVESEVKHYHSQLKGKTVYCNCDNPLQSNFVRYFVRNFRLIGLRRLIATGLMRERERGLLIDLTSVPESEDNLTEWISANVQTISDGRFQSEFCKELLNESDVVITNPPFSLYREWYDLVKGYGKQYLVLANMNTCLSANISADIIEGKARFGCNTTNREYHFNTPSGKTKRIGYICWMTNLQTIEKPYLPLIERDLSYYDKYDGQNVLKIPKLSEIPRDYDGIMGVPISILYKHNPSQFKLIGLAKHGKDNQYDLFSPHLHGKECYCTILIQKR